MALLCGMRLAAPTNDNKFFELVFFFFFCDIKKKGKEALCLSVFIVVLGFHVVYNACALVRHLEYWFLDLLFVVL